MAKITLFSRRPYQDEHSIALIFNQLMPHLASKFPIQKIVLPHYSKGIFPRWKNIQFARKRQTCINHITSDNYTALGLDGTRTIVMVHALDAVIKNQNYLAKAIFEWIWMKIPFRKAAKIICVSSFLKNEIIRRFNIPADKIRVVHNPLNAVFEYKPKLFPKGQIRLLQVGTFRVKNLNRLVLAIKGLNIHLDIIGRLDETQIKLLEDHRIQFSNSYDLSPKEMFTSYQKADIVSLVSTYEGFGLPIIEAQAVGRPVLTANIAAMPEVAAGAALLVNPFEVEDIKKGLLQIIEDKDLRATNIQKGLANVKRFELGYIAQKYIEIYKEMLD